MRRPSFLRFRSLLAPVLVLAACAASTARAALEFEAVELVLRPAPGEKSLNGVFKFKNTGATPVTITEVASGCGCTVPSWPKEAIPPGGAGEIPVSYAAGERQGRQTQVITVRTAEAQEQALRLVADMPVRITFEPRLLVLGRGAGEERTATVTYGDDTPVTLLDITSSSPLFAVAEPPPKLEGNVLKITVRYVGEPAADARGSIRIRTKGNSGKETTDLLYVRRAP